MRMFSKFTFLLLNTPILLLAQNLDNITNEKPLSATGSFSIGGTSYTSNGIAPRAKPFSWITSGNFNAKIYGIDLPFSFVLSEQDRSFQQPFNQFGIHPTYKWIKLHAGYSSLTFSPYTLGGATFLGGGVELTPGLLRFGAVYGRFNKSVKADTINNLSPGYERKGYAVKIGYGSQTNYFDLSLLKAADDINSLGNPEAEKFGLKPSENTVAALAMKQTIIKKIVWDADIAGSAYTLDSRAEKVELPQKYNALKAFYEPRISSLFALAYHSMLTFKLKKYNLKADYKRIDPGFKSMGAYYFQSDLQNFSLNQSLSLLQHKLNILYNASFNEDNLSGKKLYTTDRLTNNVALSINPSQTYGTDLTYSHFLTYQKGNGTVLQDSFKLNQQQHNIGLAPHITFVDTNSVKNIIFSANYQFLDDSNIKTARSSEMKMLTFNTQFVNTLIKSHFNWNSGFVFTHLHNYYGNINSYGLSAGVGKQMLENKLSINSNIAYSLSQVNGWISANTINLNINSSYHPTIHHGLALVIMTTNNISSSKYSNPNFYELKINLNYVYSF